MKVKCETCGQFFSNKHTLKKHIKVKHTESSSNNLIYKCSSCDKKFKIGRRLKEHFQHVHENNPNYVCELCKKGFTLPGLMEKHKVTVHLDTKDKNVTLVTKHLAAWSTLKNIYVEFMREQNI